MALVVTSLSLTVCSATGAEVTQKNNVRVAVDGELSPSQLPRHGDAPVAISLSGRISATEGRDLPRLEEIEIAINRHGRLTTRGLPACRIGRIDPSTSAEALAACGSSLVGAGSFSADVQLPEQSPFPATGKVWAFNGRFRGRPAVLAHIYGTSPAPTSYVLPFTIDRSRRGSFGATLTATLPRVTGEWGFVTGISLKLDRRFSSHGRKHSYLAAGCPAPRGLSGAVFPFARTSFSFEGGVAMNSTLVRSCRVEG